MKQLDTYKTRSEVNIRGKNYSLFSLGKLPDQQAVRRLPISLKILLENLLRHENGVSVTNQMIDSLLHWDPGAVADREIAFMPARVLLQDFTGVPCAVDFAVMRDAMVRMGGDPQKINPLQPVDLVIDHSVQVDKFGTAEALGYNSGMEFKRNAERYRFLRWTQQALRNFRVVPPETGIVHQVNLEYLARGILTQDSGGQTMIYPDTVFGTDSHTTMINGLGVLGWGVGGIEAEAAMLGQPSSMLIPQVVGFKLTGSLQPSATATDLVLRVTELLREKGVVGKFVEYFGQGLSALSLADRATIANMSPEYGATMGYFPVDDETLSYLRFTGRDESTLDLIERYYRDQGLYYDDGDGARRYSDTIELDISTISPSIAGPRRPQDRIDVSRSRDAFRTAMKGMLRPGDASPEKRIGVRTNGERFEIGHGSVVIAAITSCTNTSNPSVMIAAGLLAKKAAERGLERKPWVKTSLAPGSRVVTEYLKTSGLLPPLEKLGFHVVGYGCTTCIGNSGPLPAEISSAVQENGLIAVSVLSGNRNFEGRINPHVRANYLASPPLVVAYALAGTMDTDILNDPLGKGKDGKPVHLRDIWPSPDEISAAMKNSLRAEMFTSVYAGVFEGDKAWKSIDVPGGDIFAWDPKSTYIKAAPFFDGMSASPESLRNLTGVRVLVMLGDSVTTDHISPAGSIAAGSPAGKYLEENGVSAEDFNSYGSRRGNHEVMMRGTFANIRLRNLLVPGTEGGMTVHPDSAEPLTIFDAAMRYQKTSTPLMVIAGREYGSGSSRDWAAKGPKLLGIRVVLAESFERIHRSNLIGMGILPLQFEKGQDRKILGLTGVESYHIDGISNELIPGSRLRVVARTERKREISFRVLCRLDTPMEVEYYRHDGILRYVLRSLLKGK